VEHATAVLRVGDTGVGISPELMPSLFVPFVQGQQALDRRTGGLGLGLALVKNLVERHGGTVEVKSDGVGLGAEFTVRLPVEAAPISAVAPICARAAKTGRRVLIIEDNVDAADSLRDALELDGHEVEVALDGAEGLEKARASVPDVVLCDIGLPGMDGYEVARAVRADAALHEVTLIALTGYALSEDLRKAREAGFDLHLAKPADIDELQHTVATAPSRRVA
jgi:two-component system CheB/CheR fusion protein